MQSPLGYVCLFLHLFVCCVNCVHFRRELRYVDAGVEGCKACWVMGNSYGREVVGQGGKEAS